MATQNEKIASLKRRERRPSTPGDLLCDLLENCNLTQSDVAQRLGVSRRSVHELAHGKRALTPDMAHRLGRFFGNGPQLWLNLQQQVDLWDALHLDEGAYETIEPLRSAA